MSLDVELLRSLLLEIEQREKAAGRRVEVPVGERDQDVDFCHLLFLKEAGLIDGLVATSAGVRGMIVRGLTRAGSKLAGCIRDDESWKNLKTGVRRLGGWSAENLQSAAGGLNTWSIRQAGTGYR